MSQYTFTSDSVDRRGFIDKKTILESVTQEEIFQLVFGYLPVEFEYVKSPFRRDNNASCWFEYHGNKLRFNDFGNSFVWNNIVMMNIDCFDAVQVYYNIPNFYLTLQFINSKLIEGKPVLPRLPEPKYNKDIKQRVKLLIESRQYSIYDKNFWDPYEIRKENLIEDKVFAVKRVYALNTKRGNIVSNCSDIAYSYNEFLDGRKKLYFPHREGKRRFLTNCTKEDIGGVNTLVPYGKSLIITKSYKDCRVLRNNGRHAVWFQNEGMIPSDSNLSLLVKHFANVTVWFDNDQTGIKASRKVTDRINSIYPGKAKELYLPEMALSIGIKDPSDCIAKDKIYFKSFLKLFTK